MFRVLSISDVGENHACLGIVQLAYDYSNAKANVATTVLKTMANNVRQCTYQLQESIRS